MDGVKLSPELMKLAGIVRPGVDAAKASAGGTEFAEVVKKALEAVDTDQKVAESQAGMLARGEGDVLETMVSLNRADLSLKFALQVRNRALEAYKEIMRLPV